MKNQIAATEKIIGFFLLAVILCLSACGAPAEKEDAQQPEAEEPVEENALPGTWTVPEGWVKAESIPQRIRFSMWKRAMRRTNSPTISLLR